MTCLVETSVNGDNFVIYC